MRVLTKRITNPASLSNKREPKVGEGRLGGKKTFAERRRKKKLIRGLRGKGGEIRIDRPSVSLTTKQLAFTKKKKKRRSILGWGGVKDQSRTGGKETPLSPLKRKV